MSHWFWRRRGSILNFRIDRGTIAVPLFADPVSDSEKEVLGDGLSQDCGALSGPLRLRVQSRSRTRLRIAASIAFLFRACFKGFSTL